MFIPIIFLFIVILGIAHPRPLETHTGKKHHLSKRVVGGQDAQRLQFPWQVSLQMMDSKGDRKHFCGATIISKDQVLTAAHCLYARDLTKVKVVLGAHNIKGPEEPQVQVKSVRKARVHPGFNPNTMTNDIAVITLDVAAEFNERVKAIRLSPKDVDFEGHSCVSTGWGNTNVGSEAIEPNTLQAVHLTVISNEVCNRKLESFLNVDETMLCAHDFVGGKGACTGDSGGPLVCADSTGPYLAGVVSWGIVPCGDREHPSVFARVNHFHDFITTDSDNQTGSLHS